MAPLPASPAEWVTRWQALRDYLEDHARTDRELLAKAGARGNDSTTKYLAGSANTAGATLAKMKELEGTP